MKLESRVDSPYAPSLISYILSVSQPHLLFTQPTISHNLNLATGLEIRLCKAKQEVEPSVLISEVEVTAGQLILCLGRLTAS